MQSRLDAAERSGQEREDDDRELRAVQAQLLGTIREQKRECDEARAEADGFRQERDDAMARLTSTEKALDAAEQDRDSLEEQRDEARRRLAEVEAAAESLRRDRDRASADVAALQTDGEEARRAGTEAEQRLGELSSENGRLEARAQSLEARLEGLLEEAAALREAQEAVAAAEERVRRADEEEAAREGEEEAERGLIRVAMQRSERRRGTGNDRGNGHGRGTDLGRDGIGEGGFEGADGEYDEREGEVGEHEASTTYQLATAGNRDRDRDREGGEALVAARLAEEAGSLARLRASRASRWASSEEVRLAAPALAAAARRVTQWLSIAGSCMDDFGRAARVQYEDKRAQRRLLHDEIHDLRNAKE